jgi:hypothetical protein
MEIEVDLLVLRNKINVALFPFVDLSVLCGRRFPQVEQITVADSR